MRFTRNTRVLEDPEIDLARTVFLESIDYDEVVVADGLGLEDRPYTLYKDNPGIFTGGTYWIHMGDIAYPDLTSWKVMAHGKSKWTRKVFIHEMVHVWQGQHRFYKGVFLESVARQLCSEESIYDYDWGLEWDDYNPEQQARIVEDWFMDGASPTHKLFEYIRDNIRAG